MLLASITSPHLGLYLTLIRFPVCILHQSDCCIMVLSCTNHITAFGYLAPVMVFGNCFLGNDIMESGGCAQGMTFEKG